MREVTQWANEERRQVIRKEVSELEGFCRAIGFRLVGMLPGQWATKMNRSIHNRTA
jgi:hypothetical protein